MTLNSRDPRRSRAPHARPTTSVVLFNAKVGARSMEAPGHKSTVREGKFAKSAKPHTLVGKRPNWSLG